VFRIKTQVLPGDYNLDGVVDNEDYAVWRTTFGRTGTTLPADGNGNSVVDAADYVVWRSNLGATLGSGDGAAVPELSTWAYFLEVSLAALLLPWCHRRRVAAIRAI